MSHSFQLCIVLKVAGVAAPHNIRGLTMFGLCSVWILGQSVLLKVSVQQKCVHAVCKGQGFTAFEACKFRVLERCRQTFRGYPFQP